MDFNPVNFISDSISGVQQAGQELGQNIGSFLKNDMGIKTTAARNYADYDGDWLRYLKDMAAEGDEASIDRLMQYLMQEQSNQNARDWTANREDTAIQRFARDARAAGFNPQALFMQGGSPIASSSSGSSYSSNNYLNSYRYQNQNKVAWASLILGFSASIFKSTTSLIQSMVSGVTGGVGAAGSLGSAIGGLIAAFA